MSDFCSFCALEMFDDVNKADIKIDEIFETLEEGDGYNCLCEGCTLATIAKYNGKKAFYLECEQRWVDEEFQPIVL